MPTTHSRDEWAMIALALTGTAVSDRIYDRLHGNLFTRDMVSMSLDGEDAATVATASAEVRTWGRAKLIEAVTAATQRG